MSFPPPARLRSDCNCSDNIYMEATYSVVSALCPRIQSYTSMGCLAAKMYITV